MFTNEAIKNLDTKPIMFAYLGKIKIKKRYLKQIEEENGKD